MEGNSRDLVNVFHFRFLDESLPEWGKELGMFTVSFPLIYPRHLTTLESCYWNQWNHSQPATPGSTVILGRGGGAGYNSWEIKKGVRAKLAIVGRESLRNISGCEVHFKPSPHPHYLIIITQSLRW